MAFQMSAMSIQQFPVVYISTLDQAGNLVGKNASNMNEI